MTALEKLKKAEQKVKRLEAQVAGLRRAGEYLKESYQRLENIRDKERKAMKAEADLLRTILECAAVQMGGLELPTEGMTQMLEGKDIAYKADPEKHTIQIIVKEKHEVEPVGIFTEKCQG